MTRLTIVYYIFVQSLKNIYLLILLSIFLWVRCDFVLQLWPSKPVAQQQSFNQNVDNVTQRIFSKLTLEDRVGQLFHVNISGRTLSIHERKLLQEIAPGGVILFARNLRSDRQIKALTTQLQKVAIEANNIPLWISTDQEGGIVKRVQTLSVTQFPSAMAFGVIGDSEIVHKQGFVIGYQLKRLGINYILAPVLDVNSNPKNPIINVRSFGNDPKLVTKLGIAYLQGLADAQMLGALKHFPGHGDTYLDSHLALPVVYKSSASLWNSDFYPFRQAIAKGAESIMLAHIVYPKLDQKYPAPLSKEIVTNILRKRMQFSGLVVTDDLGMHAISKNYGFYDAIQKSVLAGADILLAADSSLGLKRVLKAKQYLIQQINMDIISRQLINTAAKRQLRLKVAKGLLTKYSQDKENDSDRLLAKMFTKKDNIINRQYDKIVKEESPEQFNRRISQLAVRSFAKSFEPMSVVNKQATVLVARSDRLLATAIRSNHSNASIRYYDGCSDFRQNLQSMLYERSIQIILAVFDTPCRKQWNRTISAINQNKQILTIGLYSGNPYYTLNVPKTGYLLLSFSNTLASREALLIRALEKSDVKISTWRLAK